VVVWTVHDACGVEAPPVMLALIHLLKLNLPTSAPNVNCAPNDLACEAFSSVRSALRAIRGRASANHQCAFQTSLDRMTSPYI